MRKSFGLEIYLETEDGQCRVSMEAGDLILVTSVIKKGERVFETSS
jgi:hypothetical protein